MIRLHAQHCSLAVFDVVIPFMPLTILLHIPSTIQSLDVSRQYAGVAQCIPTEELGSVFARKSYTMREQATFRSSSPELMYFDKRTGAYHTYLVATNAAHFRRSRGNSYKSGSS